MAANAGGESVALGGFESDDGMEHACFSGGPHRFRLPSYAAAGCVANGPFCGIAPVKLFRDRSTVVFVGTSAASSVGTAPASLFDPRSPTGGSR